MKIFLSLMTSLAEQFKINNFKKDIMDILLIYYYHLRFFID